jgi:hypothetical protein
MASRLLGRLRSVLSSVASLFTREKPGLPKRRTYHRISLEKLVMKYKRGSSPHSVYKKILANRLSQQLRQNKLKTPNKRAEVNRPQIPAKARNNRRIKKEPATQHYQTRQVKISNSKKIKEPKIKIDPDMKVEPKTEEINTTYFSPQQLVGIKSEVASDDLPPCFIPATVQAEKYAPSAPIWTPPPSPRRGSLSDVDPSLPIYSPLYPSFPSPPHYSSSPHAYISPVMPPPPPTAPPSVDYPLLPRTPQRSFSTSSLSPSTPSPPFLSTPSSLRKHFANNYVPQVKTNIPYIRPPPYSPDLPYSHNSPFSRPSPYSPTSLPSSPFSPPVRASSSPSSKVHYFCNLYVIIF